MNNDKRFSQVAEQIIAGFDTTAHTVIDAWRKGGERLGDAARERWDAALKESGPKLSAETKRNANQAREFFGEFYTRGIHLSAGGAEVAVDTLVQVARTAAERAADWQQRRA
jgi:hypothetical protein